MFGHDKHDKKHEHKENVIFKTPPKIAFIMGILVGITLTSVTAFGMTYSLLRSDLTGNNSSDNTNAKVAGAEANDPTPTPTQPTPAPTPTKVDIEVKAGEYIRGDESAPVTLIEYSDFECSFCSRVQATMEQLLEEYKGQVRIVYRHFPLSFHENAQKAAEASECAGEQGKFWEMHDKMFANQSSLGVDSLKGYAKELGLSTSQFDSCLDDGKYADKVASDFSEGAQLGVQGTPATFVNGQLVSGAQPIEGFKTIIDSALAE